MSKDKKINEPEIKESSEKNAKIKTPIKSEEVNGDTREYKKNKRFFATGD